MKCLQYATVAYRPTGKTFNLSTSTGVGLFMSCVGWTKYTTTVRRKLSEFVKRRCRLEPWTSRSADRFLFAADVTPRVQQLVSKKSKPNFLIHI